MFREISDERWEKIAPLCTPFQRKKSGGSPPLPFRTILHGIFYQRKTGCQWEMIPKAYGSKSTIHEHFHRWARAGVFDKIFQRHLQAYDELKGMAWEWQARDATLSPAPTRQARGAKA